MAREARWAGRNCFGLLSAVCAAALFLMVPGQIARAQSSGGGSVQAQSRPAAQPAAQPAAKPNLAGTWKLNQDQSDDPRAKMREAMGGGGGGGGNGGGVGMGRGGGRPGRGQGGGGGMMAEWEQLTIAQTDVGVKVNGTTGRLLATTEAQSNSNGGDSSGGMGMGFPPAVATWQGTQLVAKSQGFGGGTTTRTFELSPDGKQLIVTTKVENQRFNEPVTYKLVFDPGKAATNSQ